MPKYEVTDNVTGKRYELTGDSPPTEQELEGIFAGQRNLPPEAPATQEQDPMTVGGFVKNVGRNIGDIAKGTYQMVRHPVDTGVALSNLAAGEIASLVPESMRTPETRSLAEPATIVNKGLVEAVKHPVRTAYEHPVDVGMLASPALSLASKGAGAVGLTRTARALQKTSEIVNPTNIAEAILKSPVKAAGGIVKPKSVEKLYIKALKPIADTPEEMHQIARFGIDKGATVRYNTWLNIEEEISKVTAPVKATIEAGTMQGDQGSLVKILEGLDKMKPKAAELSRDPITLIKSIDRTKKQLIEFFVTYKNGDALSPIDIQRLKQINQRMSNYGELNAASKDAISKGLAYEAKVTLESMYPEIKDANLKASELIEFNKHLGKAVMASEKRDLVTNIAFMVKAIADQPYLKSKVAIWLDRAQKTKFVKNPSSLKNVMPIVGASMVSKQQEKQSNYKNLMENK